VTKVHQRADASSSTEIDVSQIISRQPGSLFPVCNHRTLYIYAFRGMTILSAADTVNYGLGAMLMNALINQDMYENIIKVLPVLVTMGHIGAVTNHIITHIIMVYMLSTLALKTIIALNGTACPPQTRVHINQDLSSQDGTMNLRLIHYSIMLPLEQLLQSIIVAHTHL